MGKITHNKASKPTGGQAACGLSSCYVDARTGAHLEKMKKRTLFLTISFVAIVFSAWIAIVFFYSIVPGFSVVDSRNETAESYGEITNVAPKFLPLGNDEAKLISNGNKIVSIMSL